MTTTPSDMQARLQSALGKMGSFPTCALLNYPNYINLGDHLIWLGNLFYLRKSLGTRVAYTASTVEFSPADLATATLLGIPHVFLSNNYHKNQAFYETWTVDIPYCKFISEPEKISVAVNELLGG